MAPYILTPSNTEVHVPYVVGVGYDYSEVFIDFSITRGGLDYSQNWSIIAMSSTVTGSFVGNRYYVTDVPSGRGVVTFMASKVGWDDLTVDVMVSRDAIQEAIDTALPVSYTHLRAHETPEHLVCRLLLEKKNHTSATLYYIT
mgnify:CR=1 FL=1